MVALTPESIRRLCQADHRVLVQSGAGSGAGWSDQEYIDAGATIAPGAEEVLASTDVVAAVEAAWHPAIWRHARPGTAVVGFLKPYSAPVDVFEALVEFELTAFSLDSLPRISRAQSMDVLSSLATVMGYRAVILAAERVRRFFPLLMTAAGTIPPARVLVLGAGVAGLQAIATAHRLGALVEAFDTRPEVREQVESLGATFLTMDVQSAHTQDGYAEELAEEEHRRETERLMDPLSRADAVITTAQIPGRRAPILITTDMIRGMKPGAVIVDLAAETGGNTEQTRLGEEVEFHGVQILGPKKIASQLPRDASQLFARNLTNFLAYLEGAPISWDGEHRLTIPDDELILRTVLVHQGSILHPGLEQRMTEGGMLNVAGS